MSRCIFVALLCATWIGSGLPTQAQQEGRATERNLLRVSGVGEARSNPDVAYVTVGVITQARKAQEAARANAEATQKVVDALRRQAIAEKDIQTSNYSVQPMYENRPSGNPAIIGYQVSNQVRATVRKLNTVGSVIDAALDAGANNVHSVYFSLEERAEAEAEALTKAVQDARRKAETLAKAAGLRIVSVLQINEGGAYRPVPMLEARMDMAAGVGGAVTPISPGELTVTANVGMVFETAPGMASERSRQMARLMAERTRLRVKLHMLRSRHTAQHPSALSLQRRIDALDRQIEQTRLE